VEDLFVLLNAFLSVPFDA